MAGKRIAYGCISSVKIGFHDTEQIKRTRAYQSFLNTVPEEMIVIDVITGSYRKHQKLEKLLTELGTADVIIISDVTALGFTPEEVQYHYKRIYQKGIGLLFYSDITKKEVSPYSTVGRDGKNLVSKEEFEKKKQQLRTIPIKTRQGRIKTDLNFPYYFDLVYWDFENFFLDYKTACSNQFFCISKYHFLALCRKYEKLSCYESMLEYFDDAELGHHISQKPKRSCHVPDKFPELIELVESGMSLDRALDQLQMEHMHRIDYQRFVLRYNHGDSFRKALHQAESRYLQQYDTLFHDDAYGDMFKVVYQPPEFPDRPKEFEFFYGE